MVLSRNYILFIQHRDAPALSNAEEALPLIEKDDSKADSPGNGHADDPSGGEWDDEALAAATTTTRAAGVSVGTLSISDSATNYSSASNPYIDPDNIAEKLRVEETKAALAAARDGMEQTAKKLAEEKERQQQEAAEQKEKGAGGGALGALSGSRWVPPHMRAGGVSLRDRMAGAAAGGSQRLDVANEELFPDLAAAGKMLAEKEAAEKKKSASAAMSSKPITATTGATWASKMAAKKKEREAAAALAPAAVASAKVEESKPAPAEPAPEAAPAPAAAPASASASEAPKPAIAKKPITKKKKKDLSTFKVGGAS